MPITPPGRPKSSSGMEMIKKMNEATQKMIKGADRFDAQAKQRRQQQAADARRRSGIR